MKYKLLIKAQEYTFKDVEYLKSKVRSIMEVGIWAIETKSVSEEIKEEVPEKKEESKPELPKKNSHKKHRKTKAEMIADGKQKEQGVRKKRGRLFSEEIDNFIKEKWSDKKDIDLVEMIEDKFGVKYKIDQIKANRRQMGCVSNHSGKKKSHR